MCRKLNVSVGWKKNTMDEQNEVGNTYVAVFQTAQFSCLWEVSPFVVESLVLTSNDKSFQHPQGVFSKLASELEHSRRCLSHFIFIVEQFPSKHVG